MHVGYCRCGSADIDFGPKNRVGLAGYQKRRHRVKVKKIQCSGKEKKMEIVIGVLVVIALVFVIVYLVQRT